MFLFFRSSSATILQEQQCVNTHLEHQCVIVHQEQQCVFILQEQQRYYSSGAAVC